MSVYNTAQAYDFNAGFAGEVSQPASGTVSVVRKRIGPLVELAFTLDAARIPVTDAGVSGSYGALKLFDFVESAVSYVACRQDFTAFAEGAALTAGAGDAAFTIGVGTAAKAAAADGTLAGAADDDIGTGVAVTLAGGTGTGTGVNQSAAVVDGTTTAGDIYLNWSGTAATIDANSTIDVTGTITVVGMMLGDD